MRVLLQVVTKAQVSVEGHISGSIEKGYLLFVGVRKGDDMQIAEKMADKVVKLRLFPDANGKTNLSLSDVGGKILCVSQFTLNADLSQGNRPSFTECERQDVAVEIYRHFVARLKEKATVEEGVYRADMQVELVNDGPFTVILDSKELFK